MPVTLLGIVKAPVFPSGYRTSVVLFLLYNTPSSELYLVLVISTFIAVRLGHLEKAPLPMPVTLLGMVMLVRLVQLEKAPLPMPVTLLGMVMLVRLVQLEKALSPMLVTLLGMVMLVRLMQPAKA